MKESLDKMTLEELWKLFPIVLKEHNPHYKEWYEIAMQEITTRINTDDIARISHIGSSAVKGLISKPTVDILLEIVEDCNVSRLLDDLTALGWGLMKKENKPMKFSFNKGYTPDGFADRVYHLHVRYLGDWDELYFRDYLIEHDNIAAEYSKLKLSLQSDFERDRDRYTDEKSDFVLKYSTIAKQEFQNKYKPS